MAAEDGVQADSPAVSTTLSPELDQWLAKWKLDAVQLAPALQRLEVKGPIDLLRVKDSEIEGLGLKSIPLSRFREVRGFRDDNVKKQKNCHLTFSVSALTRDGCAGRGGPEGGTAEDDAQ